jgi:cyclase
MHLRSLALLACALVAPPVSAQAPRYRVETLAPGVHAVIYDSEVDVEGNTLVVVNDEDVFVVDANAGVTTAKATIEEIRKITPKPVRYVVNTHWHDDHVMGNQAYADAYPGVQFIAHPLTRQDIVGHAFANNAYVLHLIEADIIRLSGYLQTNTYREGKPLTPELKTRIEAALRNRKEALADRKVFRAVPPTVDVADSMTLKRGGREIQIRFLGRGNTRGDLVVFLPRERIVATGDLVVYPIPYATNVYAQEWVKTLGKLMAMPAATVLPGHGPVMRDWSYVRKVQGALEQTLAAVAAAKKEGLTLAQTTERVQLPELRDSFVNGRELMRPGYEAFFRTSLVRNAWEELDAEVMKAYARLSLQPAGNGVYEYGGTRLIVNDTDVVIVNGTGTPSEARASVRAFRELTDKPVRYIVATASDRAHTRGLATLREAYPQADVVGPSAAVATIVVSDVMTLHRGGREIRITKQNDGTLRVQSAFRVCSECVQSAFRV